MSTAFKLLASVGWKRELTPVGSVGEDCCLVGLLLVFVGVLVLCGLEVRGGLGVLTPTPRTVGFVPLSSSCFVSTLVEMIAE